MAVRPHARSAHTAYIAAVYISPTATPAVIASLLACMKAMIVSRPNDHILIAGDFNARDPAWGDTVSTPSSAAITQFLIDTGTFTLNQIYLRGKATRPAPYPGTGSIIDLIITNRPACVFGLEFALEYGLSSDHRPMQLDISRNPADIVLDIPSPILSSQRIQWQTRKADWDLFESLLSAVVPAIDTPLPLPRNHAEAQSVVDERATTIRDTIIEAAHASMHTRKPGVNTTGERSNNMHAPHTCIKLHSIRFSKRLVPNGMRRT
jgi:hypothetical protein